jgi:hypothetical protein
MSDQGGINWIKFDRSQIEEGQLYLIEKNTKSWDKFDILSSYTILYKPEYIEGEIIAVAKIIESNVMIMADLEKS